MLGWNGRRVRVGCGGLRWRERRRRRPAGRHGDPHGGGASGEGGERLSEELGVHPLGGGVLGDGEAVRQRLIVAGVGILLLSPSQGG